MRAGLSALAILAALCSGTPARAETSAETTIHQLKLLSATHTNRRLFQGALWLEYDKAERNYRWGGVHCAKRELGPSVTALLIEAFSSRYRVMLDYEINQYEGKPYYCITGVAVTRS